MFVLTTRTLGRTCTCLHPLKIKRAKWLRSFATVSTPQEPTVPLNNVNALKAETVPKTASQQNVVPPKRRSLLKLYLELSKARLGFFVVVTTGAGYLMGPCPVSLLDFLIVCTGTSLTIASANSINQYIEVDSDIKMRRTATRPLPSRELSLNHALAFGIATGGVGSAILLTIGPIPAALAFGNILLYTLVYTLMKRVHWLNTWVGAVVGGIPPMIGWAANTGSLELGAWILGYSLLVWQLPHFFALSYPLKQDYERAGLKMLVTEHPQKVPSWTFFHTFLLVPIVPLAVYANLTSPLFAMTGTVLNLYMLWSTHKFYRSGTAVDARKVFFATLFYLPALMGLLLLHKSAGYIFGIPVPEIPLLAELLQLPEVVDPSSQLQTTHLLPDAPSELPNTQQVEVPSTTEVKHTQKRDI